LRESLQNLLKRKITDEEFNDIEHEIKNYKNTMSNILAEYNKGKYLNNDLKFQLIDKGRTLGIN
jgi:DNA-binding cell septation regulator SpoVG